MPMPTPSKELEDYMKKFAGTWKCDTRFPAGAMGPGSPEMTAKTTVKIKKDLGGFFYKGEFSLPKSKTMPMAMTGVFYLGYDPGQKQLIQFSVDNTGGAFMGAGPISGDSATWSGEGYMGGMKMKFRETLTLVAANQATHKIEMDMGKGMQLMGEDTCKK
jgi:hypothetical protein